MDGGVGEPVNTNLAVPKIIATARGPKKAGAGRPPLKTLDAFTVTASKGCTPKRRLSASSDKPQKAARRTNATAGGGSSAVKTNQGEKAHEQGDSDDVCSEVTSSCDSDKLSLHVPSKVVGPLDGYTCVLPHPDPIGVSSTIEEGLKQAQSDVVLVDSEDCTDEDGDTAKQLNESCSSNSTSGDVRSSQHSSPMDGISAPVSETADSVVGKKSVKRRSGTASELRDQKRLLLEEKKKQKAAEKLEKQKRIQEDKERREQEKQAKEAERKQKQEEKERERLDKERERLEKLQEKEEKRKRKSEVELKQLEEKRRKEDEKQKAEEEKQRQQLAQKNLMLSFFKKAEKPEQPLLKREPAAAVEPSAGAASARFKPFQVKDGMKLAPVLRRHVTDEELRGLDAAIQAQGGSCVYTTELRDSSFVARKSGATVPHVYQDEEVHVVEVDQTGTHMCKKKRYMKAKLLQFTENYRPAYYGTWRKRSSVVRARRPFVCDPRLLNYEVDSDEEWDEEEPGESTSVKDDDEEDDEGIDEGEEMDPELQSEGFLVEHGYLSDGEGANADEEEEEGSLEQRKEKQRLLNRLDWEQKKRRQRTRDQLRAIVIGCFYDDGSKEVALRKAGELDTLRQYQAVVYASVPIATALCSPELLPPDDDGREPGELGCATPGLEGSAAERSASRLARRSGGSSGHRRGRECQAIPEEAMPDLLWLVHGNVLGLQHIIKEFVCYWKRHDSSERAASTSAAAPSSHNENGDKKSPTVEPSPAAVCDAKGGCESPSRAESASPPTHPVSTADSDSARADASPRSGGATSVVAADEAGRTISKRQLGIKIRAMAVYEKRDTYKRICWYVHEEAINRYFGGEGQRSKSELTVPTTWKYVSRQQQTPSVGRPAKGPKVKGAVVTEDASHGRRVTCVTPKSASRPVPSDDAEPTVEPDAGPTPRKTSLLTPGGLTPITNFTVAKTCQPRRIVPTAVSTVTGAAVAAATSSELPDGSTKLVEEVARSDLPKGGSETSTFVPKGGSETSTVVPPPSMTSGPTQGSVDPPKSRRITLTTLYAAPTCSGLATPANTSGMPKPSPGSGPSHVVSAVTAPNHDHATALVLPQSNDLEAPGGESPAGRSLPFATASLDAGASLHPSLAVGGARADDQRSLGASHKLVGCMSPAQHAHNEPDEAKMSPANFAQTVPESVTVGPGSCTSAGSTTDCYVAGASTAEPDVCNDGMIRIDLTQPAQGRRSAGSKPSGQRNSSGGTSLCLLQEQCSGINRLAEPAPGASSCLVKPANGVVVVSDDDSIL